ncbi:hypothetical protein K1719_004697 [Acacia pycnantha]|nr:hypothetical protein K1719_004697 [Acacia pycnantha]
MAILQKKPMAYSKMEKEDPEERIHRRAQFLIYKVLVKADSQRKSSSCLGIRISKIKVKIGSRMKKMRKRIVCHLKSWKRLFAGRGRQACVISLPSLFN